MGDYADHFERDDRPLAPWLTNETRTMTEAEMREAIESLPGLPDRGNVLFSGSTADGTIPVNEPCAQCRIEIAAGERTERDPDCPCADPDAAADPDPRCPKCNGEMQDDEYAGLTLRICEDCGYNA